MNYHPQHNLLLSVVVRGTHWQGKHPEYFNSYLFCFRLKDSVSAVDATGPEIISYHPQHDLLPLVLAHCNYSLTAGKGATIQYDFTGLGRVIEERFITHRPRLRPQVCHPWYLYITERLNTFSYLQMDKLHLKLLVHLEIYLSEVRKVV